jgi:hypothetical protein
MARSRAVAAVLLLAFASPAAALCPDSDAHFDPAWVGAFKTYGIPTSLLDVTAKTAKICAGCEVPLRGVQLKAKRDFGGGYLQLPFEVGATFCARARVDVSKLTGPGALATVEFDSPAVAVDGSPVTYVVVAVEDVLGVRTVSVEVSGADAGTPLELEAGVEQVMIELEYAGNLVDVRAWPEGADATTIANDVAFAYAGSGRLGVGAFALVKGDRAGIAIAASGEIFAASFRDLVASLQDLGVLADSAVADLASALPADARAKLVEAQGILDPGVLTAVAALPESKARTYAEAQLAKVAARLAQAVAGIDAGTPASLKSAEAAARKAGDALARIERVLRTGSVAEAKVRPPG